MPGLPGVSHQPADHPDEPPGHSQAGVTAHSQPGLRQRVRQAGERGKQAYAGSWAEHVWHRLDAVNFMDQAMLLAATLLLAAVPFLLVVAGLAGRSAVSGLTRRLGLSQQAAADVGHLVTSSGAASGTVTGMSWVFFILAGIAGATAIQRLYQRVFDLDPRGTSDKLHVVIWLAVAVGWMLLGDAAGPGLRHAGPVLFWIVALVALTGSWWFTMWLLLAGRVPWRRLLPCAVATGALWVGMGLVFSVIFSGMVTGDDQRYGPIGVVFALMSLFIAIGVVLILGAAVGLMWQERGLSFRAAVRKLRRAS
jgi:membrane protein